MNHFDGTLFKTVLIAVDDTNLNHSEMLSSNALKVVMLFWASSMYVYTYYIHIA